MWEGLRSEERFFVFGYVHRGFLSLAACLSCFVFVLPPAFSPLLFDFFVPLPLFSTITAV